MRQPGAAFMNKNMHNSVTEELFLDIGNGELRLPRRRLGLYYQLTRKADVRANSTSHTETLKVSLALVPTQGTGTQSCLVLPRTCKMQSSRFNVAELVETMVVIFRREVLILLGPLEKHYADGVSALISIWDII